MEILYPLPALSESEPSADSSITVLVDHTVSTEHRAAFFDALHPLLTTFGQAHGALGCRVFEKADGSLTRITILQRFASAADHDTWLQSSDFARWRASVTSLQPTLDSIRHYSGLAALFAAGQSPDAPPRWKMAIVLLLAVFPLSLALSIWFGQALASIPPLLGALISSPIMVILMTYIMVPLLTRIFASWLQPARKQPTN